MGLLLNTLAPLDFGPGRKSYLFQTKKEKKIIYLLLHIYYPISLIVQADYIIL